MPPEAGRQLDKCCRFGPASRLSIEGVDRSRQCTRRSLPFRVSLCAGTAASCGTKSERIYREVKVMMIGGGSEEIMKDLAARQLGV